MLPVFCALPPAVLTCSSSLQKRHKQKQNKTAVDLGTSTKDTGAMGEARQESG